MKIVKCHATVIYIFFNSLLNLHAYLKRVHDLSSTYQNVLFFITGRPGIRCCKGCHSNVLQTTTVPQTLQKDNRRIPREFFIINGNGLLFICDFPWCLAAVQVCRFHLVCIVTVYSCFMQSKAFINQS